MVVSAAQLRNKPAQIEYFTAGGGTRRRKEGQVLRSSNDLKTCCAFPSSSFISSKETCRSSQVSLWLQNIATLQWFSHWERVWSCCCCCCCFRSPDFQRLPGAAAHKSWQRALNSWSPASLFITSTHVSCPACFICLTQFSTANDSELEGKCREMRTRAPCGTHGAVNNTQEGDAVKE